MLVLHWGKMARMEKLFFSGVTDDQEDSGDDDDGLVHLLLKTFVKRHTLTHNFCRYHPIIQHIIISI